MHVKADMKYFVSPVLQTSNSDVTVVHVFSERDGHTQAVEEHRAPPEKSHADRLPARSVQVGASSPQPPQLSPCSCVCVCCSPGCLSSLLSLQWEQMQQMEEECGALRGTITL